ncbi:MAG: transcription antitermination factor NusB [Erysipelotrichaceae bacterium]|nr:transcription antitermination factor NusB [Erysipelotrichaceae bacterium]
MESFNRHQLRYATVCVIYQDLLLKNKVNFSIKQAILDIFEVEEVEQIDEYAYQILKKYINNKDRYIDEVSEHLVNFTFERLNMVEQAILIVAVIEMSLKQVDKAVIINEAVELAKEYIAEEESYKFINGVLDNFG